MLIFGGLLFGRQFVLVIRGLIYGILRYVAFFTFISGDWREQGNEPNDVEGSISGCVAVILRSTVCQLLQHEHLHGYQQRKGRDEVCR